MAKTIFKTERTESFRQQLTRRFFNLVPSYRRGGGRVRFISDDWQEIHVSISLNLLTRNYVGTVFGGSIYAALDPIYMVQLIRILGNNYIIWDKSAEIRFLKPITKTVYARFLVDDALIEAIKTKIQAEQKFDFILEASFEDENGTIYAKVTKVLYVADKNYYQNRKK